MDNIQFTKIRKGYVLENSNIDKKVYLKFDKIKDISCGYTRVSKKNKGRNIINPQGELVWKEDKWFNEAWNFQTDCVYDIIAKCARVRIDYTVHYISTNGNILKPSSYNNNNNFMGFNQWLM